MQRKTALSCLTLFTAAFAGPLEAAPLGFDEARELLIVERVKDAKERDRVLRRMWNVRVTLRAEKASARELLVPLNLAAHKKTGFMLWPRMDELVEPVSLRLERARLLDVMSILRKTTPIRWVYGNGVIWAKHESQVQEETFMRVYDLRMALARVRDFPGPRMGLGRSDYEEREPVGEGRSVSGLDLDRIQELVLKHVEPDSWEREGVTMSAGNRILIVHQTMRGHRKLQRFLRQLRVL